MMKTAKNILEEKKRYECSQNPESILHSQMFPFVQQQQKKS